MKAHVKAFGCTMSQGESLELAEMLMLNGVETVSESEEADVSVIHTCVVIDGTVKDMVREVEKDLLTHSEVHLFGCLPPTLPHLVEGMDGVRLWNFGQEREFVRGVTQHAGALALPEAGGDLSVPLPIATGCLGNCSYCLTKRARGDLVSRPPEEVARRFDELLARGYREFKVTAQDTGCYGADIGTDLPTLANLLLRRDGDFRLRIGMMNPNRITDDIIGTLGKERVYRFLHMPVQSGSDGVLAKMRRGYTAERVRGIVERVRERVPDVNISTDVIIGHPGESEEDFRMTLDLIEEMEPGIVNVTRYSPRPGTIATSMKDVVDGATVKRRSGKAAETARGVTGRFLRRFEGTEADVFTVKRSDGHVAGRTGNYLLVELPPETELGITVRARLKGLKRVSFRGEPI